MSAAAVETLLARLYSDDALRREFLADPGRIARAAGLDPAEVTAMAAIDRTGLEMAAESYSRKRSTRTRRDSRDRC
jgi:hypothetical protein